MDKVILKPGDVVRLKQCKELDYAPLMYVLGPENNRFPINGKDNLKGLRCRWFTRDMMIQEGVFSTKDLELIKSFNQ